MKRVVSILLTVVMIFSIFSATAVSTVSASEAMTKDQIALDIANGMKATMRSEAASFQADGKFAADLAKEIVTKESVLQFCGEGFSTAIFSLANLWNYTDLITSAGEKGLYMYLCFSVINDGLEYMKIGDTYFEEMNKILDKYGDGDIYAPGDARNVIKYRYYGAQYYLCGTKMCMPFIDEYANGKTLSDVFGESLYKGVSTSMGSFIIGDIFEFDDLADLWDLIGNTSSGAETITSYIKKNTIPQLDFTQIDNLLDMITYTDDADIATISNAAESVNTANVNTHSTALSDLFKLSSDKSFGNVTIENSLDLAGKTMTVNGNLYVKASVDINYGKLIVNGNLIQSSGKMYINGGTLEVNGDYRIQTHQQNPKTGEMEFVESSGYLYMSNVYDYVKIKGDFVTQSNRSSISDTTTGTSKLSNGVMEIGGDFSQISSNETGHNFDSYSSHTVILNGTSQQVVSFESSLSGINQLQVDNPNIQWKGYMSVKKFISDADINSDNLTIYNIDVNKNNIKIMGDVLVMGDTVNLNYGSLTIDGNLYQASGEMYINGGTLEVNGDYRIQTHQQNPKTGEMEFVESSGYLYMSNVYDYVKIKGDFVTQSNRSSISDTTTGTSKLSNGVMEIGGDFSQISSNKTGHNFDSYGSHTVILNGTDNVQHIVFDSTSSHFNILKLTKDKNKNYIFIPDECWKELYLDTDVESVQITNYKKTVKQCEKVYIVAKVNGINNPSQKVNWILTGSTDNDTIISDKGVLTVGLNEKAEQITITATSVQDQTKSASVTIAIEKIDAIINGVAITPSVVSSVCGEKCEFNAVVFGLYNPPQDVTWLVSGNKSVKTTISKDGVLTIAENETADSVTVKAVSTYDSTMFDEVTVDIMQIKITSSVNNVTVTMNIGEKQKFVAVVTGANNPDQQVVWSVSGNNSSNTVISKNGELTIGEDETSSIVIVKATSVEDSSKYGEFAINVNSNGGNTIPSEPDSQPSTGGQDKPTDPTDPIVIGLLGDANGDGKVNVKDATEIQKAVAGLLTLDETEELAADVDGSGTVNVKDATAIQKWVAGIETGFLIGEPVKKQ